jgi:G3E family GTPase
MRFKAKGCRRRAHTKHATARCAMCTNAAFAAVGQQSRIHSRLPTRLCDAVIFALRQPAARHTGSKKAGHAHTTLRHVSEGVPQTPRTGTRARTHKHKHTHTHTHTHTQSQSHTVTKSQSHKVTQLHETADTVPTGMARSLGVLDAMTYQRCASWSHCHRPLQPVLTQHDAAQRWRLLPKCPWFFPNSRCLLPPPNTRQTASTDLV